MVTVTHHANINVSAHGLRLVHRDCLFNVAIKLGPIKLWKGIHVDFRVGRVKNKSCVMLLLEVSHHMKGCLKVSLASICKVCVCVEATWFQGVVCCKACDSNC